MKVTLGKEGLTFSWQEEFPEMTGCCWCQGKARIGFVAHEKMSDDDKGPYVCDLHSNEGKGSYWLHDCCAVAVYFCKDCLGATALRNQG